MTIYKIEQLEENKDLSNIKIDSFDLEMIETFEEKETILEDNGRYSIGSFSTRYIDFIKYLFKKYNVKYKITNITSKYGKAI